MTTRRTVKLSEDEESVVNKVVCNVELRSSGKDDDLDREFEVCMAGRPADWRYHTIEMTADIFEKLKKNFDRGVLGIDVALDSNHKSSNGALAWVKSLKVSGDMLFATFRDWTEEGKAALKERKFKYFSIEFGFLVKTNDDGEKTTVPNVLKGIGMTNRPAIRGLAPTYLSESIKNDLGEPNQPSDKRNDDMKVKEMIKKFGASLLGAEGGVSEADRKRFSEMTDGLSEDDRDESVDKLSADVEAKAVKTAEAETKALSEKLEADDRKKEDEKSVELSQKEKDEKLAELSGQVETLTADNEKRELAEAIEALMLSAETHVGFVKPLKDRVEKFAKGLSSGQRGQFTELLDDVRFTDKKKLIDLDEVGTSKEGDTSVKCTEAKLAEANKSAKKLAKDEGIELHEALAKVYEEMGLTDEPQTE